jgi:hypothetical protein
MSSEPATPKQIAYLTFMGVRHAERLSREKASETIQNLDNVSDIDEYERIRQMQREWGRTKFIRFPELYTYEFRHFIIQELPESLHHYVRSCIVGASKRLTRKTVRQVIYVLGREEADWWKRDDFKDRFMARLQAMHPGCCDGKAPDHKPKARGRKNQTIKSSCASVILLGAIIVFMIWYLISRS